LRELGLLIGRLLQFLIPANKLFSLIVEYTSYKLLDRGLYYNPMQKDSIVISSY